VEILESTGQSLPFEPKLMPDEPAAASVPADAAVAAELETVEADAQALAASADALEAEAGAMEEQATMADATTGLASLDGDPDGEVVAAVEEEAPEEPSMDGPLDEAPEAPMVDEPLEETIGAQVDEAANTELEEPADAVDTAPKPEMADDFGGELA
jgi:hypothetical protein